MVVVGVNPAAKARQRDTSWPTHEGIQEALNGLFYRFRFIGSYYCAIKFAVPFGVLEEPCHHLEVKPNVATEDRRCLNAVTVMKKAPFVDDARKTKRVSHLNHVEVRAQTRQAADFQQFVQLRYVTGEKEH